LKHGQNTVRRIAGIEPFSERVLEKIVPRASFVRFQGIVKYLLEVGRCGNGLSVRHMGEVRLVRN
jgi:hypothetical protein